MAFRERNSSPAPESTDQLCAMESIWHSWFEEEPSGEPSSKYARRYHSPSHAFCSMLCCSWRASDKHLSANTESPRREASSAKRAKISYRKNPSHTLSPLPCSPTRFMPSFQSPDPIRGRPCSPYLRAARIDCTQWSYKVLTVSDRPGRS